MKSSSHTSRRRRQNRHQDFYEAMPMASTAWTAMYDETEQDVLEHHGAVDEHEERAKRTAIITLIVVGLITAAFGFLLLAGLEATRGTLVGAETLTY